MPFVYLFMASKLFEHYRSSCPYPRLDFDDTKYCKKCKSITPFKNGKCIVCLPKTENLMKFLSEN